MATQEKRATAAGLTKTLPTEIAREVCKVLAATPAAPAGGGGDKGGDDKGEKTE